MSEQLDYVNAQIEKAFEDSYKRWTSGHIPTEKMESERGFLRGLQSVVGFQKEYIQLKNPKREEDE